MTSTAAGHIFTGRRFTRTERKRARERYEARMKTPLRPGARQLFADLQKRRFLSRPILTPARTVRVRGSRVVIPPVYGEPTFRNVIDAAGQHV